MNIDEGRVGVFVVAAVIDVCSAHNQKMVLFLRFKGAFIREWVFI